MRFNKARTLVEESVYEEFKKLLVAKLSKVVGDPREPTTNIGPLIGEKTAGTVVEAVEEAVREGAILLYGGRELGSHYIEPALVEVRDKNILLKLRPASLSGKGYGTRVLNDALRDVKGA